MGSMMVRLWFSLYSRNGKGTLGSCAFEHVFVGELKGRNKVIGLHNWITFWNLERHGQLDYHGFYVPNGRRVQHENLEESHVVTVKFDWRGLDKSLSTILVGVSPEFELALYTMAFFADPSEYPYDERNCRTIVTSVDGDRILVKVWKMVKDERKGLEGIAAAYVQDIKG